jgi:hypothetical protein
MMLNGLKAKVGNASTMGVMVIVVLGSMRNDAAQRLGAVLRSQALGHIRKHMDRYRPSLMKDESTSPESPAPSESDIQTKVDEYLCKAAEATTWIDGVLRQACSEKLGVPLIIWWKSQHEVWKTHVLAFDSQRILPKLLKVKSQLCWPLSPNTTSGCKHLLGLLSHDNGFLKLSLLTIKCWLVLLRWTFLKCLRPLRLVPLLLNPAPLLSTA